MNEQRPGPRAGEVARARADHDAHAHDGQIVPLDEEHAQAVLQRATTRSCGGDEGDRRPRPRAGCSRNGASGVDARRRGRRAGGAGQAEAARGAGGGGGSGGREPQREREGERSSERRGDARRLTGAPR